MLENKKIDDIPEHFANIEEVSDFWGIHWRDDDIWLGYLEEYPDYMTQGETIEELEENLRDIYKELSSGSIPCVRRIAELKIA